MRNILALALSLSITAYAQEPPPQPPVPSPAPIYAPQDAPPLIVSPTPDASPAAGDITLPAGTKIQLYLTNPLHSRTAQIGDTVHAEVAFPVVIANQLAIPRGAYVEGAVTRVTRPGFSHRAKIQLQFTRIIFENGYQLPLPGASAEASNQTYSDAVREIVAEAWPESDAPTTNSAVPFTANSAVPFAMLELLAFQFPVNPPPPTLPPQRPLPGQSRAEAIGIVAGVAIAAVAIIGIAHRGREIYLDSGWQLEMTLQSPITLDAAQANAPIPAP
jgi:hypothetical protein